MRIAFRHVAHVGLIVAFAGVLTAGALVSVAAGNASHTKRHARLATCSQVDFKPDSDDLAFNITTAGVDCATGRTVVKRAAPESLRPGPNRFYRSGHFVCRGTFMKPVGKWYEHYVCRSAHARIVFDRG